MSAPKLNVLKPETIKFMINLSEIGFVESVVAEPKDDAWGNVVSEIHLKTNFSSGLQGLEEFSHLIVVFWLHKSGFDIATDLVRRPRGRDDMPEVGIFAQRAKHRPNPLGITAVKLLGVTENVIKVQGLDAIDGTPVLDIKPYFAGFDRVEKTVEPEWVNKLMSDYF